jgi:hypothetical protein
MRAFLDRIFIETIPFRRSMCIQLAAAAAAAATTRAQWQRRVGGHARQAIPIGGGLRVLATAVRQRISPYAIGKARRKRTIGMIEAKSDTLTRKRSVFSRV